MRSTIVSAALVGALLLTRPAAVADVPDNSGGRSTIEPSGGLVATRPWAEERRAMPGGDADHRTTLDPFGRDIRQTRRECNKVRTLRAD